MTTCLECANYRPQTSHCAEHVRQVDGDDVCGRFLATDGSTVPENFRPFLTRRIAPEEPEVATKPKRRLSRAKVVELLLAGKTQMEIAEEYGVAQGTVSTQASTAVAKGEILRVGRGKYAPVPKEAPAEAAPMDDERLEAIKEGVDEVRWATTEQVTAIEQLMVAVLELRAEIAELRAMVQAGQADGDDKQLVDRLLALLEAQLGVRGGAA